MDTLFTGKVIKHFSVVTSTNELAANALKKGNVIEGTLFLADAQTSGKGQRGSSWISEAGQNILASYVFHPHFLNSDQQFQLIKAVSLAVKDLLDPYLIEKATIKWPNDIYVNEFKIAGILVESVMKGSKMGSSIVGIGLNVNQRYFGELPNATSIALETGRGRNVDLVLEELSHHLEHRYLQIRRNIHAVNEEYRNSLYRLNQKTGYIINHTHVELIPVGVDEFGRLILRNEHGRENAFALHEVKQII